MSHGEYCQSTTPAKPSGRKLAETWNAMTSNTSSKRRAKPSARLVSDPA